MNSGILATQRHNRDTQRTFRGSLQPLIASLTHALKERGYTPVVHFELEGVCQFQPGVTALNYAGVNRDLARCRIAGELKPEYWPCQWEYASLFQGQTPLQEADYLARAMAQLPQILRQHGAKSVSLVPVAWDAVPGRYIAGSSAIFAAQDKRPVHVPNAVQVNVSVQDSRGQNLIPDSSLGEWLQRQLLETSFACSLLFLPEEDAYKRLALRTEYHLDAELSSPYELSGGHQGSIALYKQWDKHNRPMGNNALLYASDDTVLSYQQDWRSTARVEHRLGATSGGYDPYLNMAFILVNLWQAIERWQGHGETPAPVPTKAMPVSLDDNSRGKGAISLFRDDTWFAQSINTLSRQLGLGDAALGDKIKQQYLGYFCPAISI